MVGVQSRDRRLESRAQGRLLQRIAWLLQSIAEDEKIETRVMSLKLGYFNGLAVVSVVLIALLAASASAGPRPMRDCDNDGLAECLNTADNEFYDCEKDCQAQYPDDPVGYHECRDQCREVHDGVRQECYKQYCPKSFKKRLSPKQK
jgi:hypothetical protein